MGRGGSNRAACSAAASAQAASASWAFAWWTPADAGSHQIPAAAFDPGPRPHGATARRAGCCCCCWRCCSLELLAGHVTLTGLLGLFHFCWRSIRCRWPRPHAAAAHAVVAPPLAAEGSSPPMGRAGLWLGRGAICVGHHGRRRANCRLSRLLTAAASAQGLRRLRHGLAGRPCGAPVCAPAAAAWAGDGWGHRLGAVVATVRRLALAAPAGCSAHRRARRRVRHTGATGRGAAWR